MFENSVELECYSLSVEELCSSHIFNLKYSYVDYRYDISYLGSSYRVLLTYTCSRQARKAAVAAVRYISISTPKSAQDCVLKSHLWPAAAKLLVAGGNPTGQCPRRPHDKGRPKVLKGKKSSTHEMYPKYQTMWWIWFLHLHCSKSWYDNTSALAVHCMFWKLGPLGLRLW